jgi:hypothetical protein
LDKKIFFMPNFQNTPQFDLTAFLSECNSSQTFQNLLSAYSWRKSGTSYRCKEHSGHAIFKKGNVWFFKANNGEFNSSDLWNLSKELHPHLDFADRVDLIAKAANVDPRPFYSDPTQTDLPAFQKLDRKDKLLANYKKDFVHVAPATAPSEDPTEPKKPKKPLIYATKGSKDYQAVQKYLTIKTGLRAQNLESFGIYPLPPRQDENYSFAYIVGKTVKVKSGLVIGGKRISHHSNDDTTPYRFGEAATIPKNARQSCILALTEGEDDAICINANHLFIGKSRVVAASFGGSSYLSGEALDNAIKDGFFENWCGVLICGDLDKAGAKANKEAAQKLTAAKYEFNVWSLPKTDDFKPFEGKDICDLYQHKTATKDGKTLLLESLIESYTLTKPTAYSLTTKYLSSKSKYLDASQKDLVFGILIRSKKLMVQAPTGAGKTTLIKAMFDDLLSRLNGVERLIFCVPTLAILEQIKADLTASNTDFCSLSGSTTNEMWNEAAHAKIILTTQKQIENIPKTSIQTSCLIIDETHTLTNDVSYRYDTCYTAFKAAQTAKYCLCLSATPPAYYSNFGFEYLKLDVAQTQKKTVNFIKFEAEKASERASATLQFIKEKSKEGTVAVFQNDVDSHENYVELLERDGLKCTIISSKEARYKDENPHYQSIVKDGVFDGDVDVVFFTSLLEAGVSIKSNVQNLLCLSKVDTDQLAQIIARFRHTDTTNSELNIFIASKYDGKDEAIFEAKISSYAPENSLSIENYTSTQLAAATATATAYNEAQTVKSDDLNIDKYLIFENGIWSVNTPAILYDAKNLEQSRLTKYGFIEELKEYDKTVTFGSFITYELDEPADDDTQPKEAKIEAKIEALKFVDADLNKAVFVAYSEKRDQRNPKAKEYKQYLGSNFDDLKSTNLYQITNQVKRHVTKLVDRLFKLRDIKSKSKLLASATDKQLFQIVKSYDTDTDFKRFFASLVLQLEQKENTDVGHFRREFERAYHNSKKETLTPYQAAQLAQKTDGKIRRIEQGKELILIFFDVEKQQGKGGIKYKVLRVRDALKEAQNIINPQAQNVPKKP